MLWRNIYRASIEVEPRWPRLVSLFGGVSRLFRYPSGPTADTNERRAGYRVRVLVTGRAVALWKDTVKGQGSLGPITFIFGAT
jgi:hypothetical protein